MTDLKYALRMARRFPGLAAAIVITLALGLGANTLVFTLVNSLAFRPVPVPDAGQMVRLYPIDDKGRRQNLFSYADYADHARDNPHFEALIAYVPALVTIGAGDGMDGAAALRHGIGRSGQAEEGVADMVSGNYFSALRTQPALGRLLSPDDTRSVDTSTVTVISHRYWERRLGSDPGIVGKTLTINGRAFVIVGVAARDFVGTEPLSPALWVPITAQRDVLPGPDLFEARKQAWLLVLGRVRAGSSRAHAEAGANVIAERLAIAYPSADRTSGAVVRPATFFVLDADILAIVWLTVIAVGFVLVVACANVANLMLARTVARAREVAIRAAVGASRAQIIRALLIECGVLGLAGGGLGLLVSWWMLDVLLSIARAWVPYEWATVVLDLNPDWRVFAYSLALSLFAAVGFGLAPALHASRTNLTAVMSGARHAITTRGGVTGWPTGSGVLAAVQVALAVVLLTGAALLTRASQRAATLDLGFDTDRVVMTEYDLARHRVDQARAAEFNRTLAATAGTLPHVETWSFASHVPLTGGVTATSVSPVSNGEPSTRAVPARYARVSASYFTTLGIVLVRGRTFDARDEQGQTPSVVIGEAVAARLWPGEDPIGKSVRTAVSPAPAEVVGVVRDTRARSLWLDKEAAIYLPITPGTDPRELALVVRVTGEAAAVSASLQVAARRADPHVLFRARPLSDVLALWILPSRVAAGSAAIIGALALALALVGVYGALAHVTGRRTREIGVRVALGATTRQVTTLVLGQGLRVALSGLAVGLLLSLALARAVAPFLFGVSAADPVSFAGVGIFLFCTVVIACGLPARRAARVQPVVALREE